MKFKFSVAQWVKKHDGTWISLCTTKENDKAIQELILSLDGSVFECEIKKHREKRSINANNYSWVLTDQLADVLGKSKEETHFEMLKQYGQKTVVSVVKEASEVLMGSVEYWESIGESELNGKIFEHFKVFKGSKNFDTREMAIFIDGIISECKEQGIETMTPAEIQRLKEGWKNYGK